MKQFLLLALLTAGLVARGQGLASEDMAKGVAAYKKKDYKTAFKYFDREARKDAPNPDAFYYIGQYYDKGLGMKKNPNEALTLYKLGAQTEPYSLKAINEQLDIYRTGRNGLAKDAQGAFLKASSLLKLDKENEYPDKYYILGEMYWKGAGTSRNLDEAASLLFLGSAVYKCKPCVPALKTLGQETYKQGLAAYQDNDIPAAVKYYTISTKAKCVDAMLALGDIYYSGIVKVNNSKAWGDGFYDQAADLGSEIAIKKRRPEVTDQHLLYVLSAKLKQPDGSFKPFPYRFTGKGLVKWDNGDYYEGEFFHGSIFGKGKFFNKNGVLLHGGSFNNGVLSDGEAITTQPDGSVYRGYVSDGKPDGRGELTSASGVYQGTWKNGLQQGLGRLKTPDGTIYWGNYADGKLEGEGSVIFADGRKAKGSFSGGEMKGKWDYYNYKTGYIEVRDYSSNGVFTSYKKPVTESNRAELARQSREYDEWWEKTYGKGGSQSGKPMPNMNAPQTSYRTAGQSEAERHQKAMDQIYRDTEKQMKRGNN